MKFILVIVLVFVSACAQDSSEHLQEKPSQTTPQLSSKDMTPPPPSESEFKAGKVKMITLRGTILYKTLEGGFFGFDADNGRKYTPSGLKSQYRKHGLIVEVTGVINTNMATFQQYGPVLMIKSVNVIDDSKVGKNLDNSH